MILRKIFVVFADSFCRIKILANPIKNFLVARFQTAKSIWENEFVAPVKSIKLSYLPPLMVYFAAGVSGLTGVVETFIVTKVLGMEANLLAVLAFWAGIWWAFKMPIGHLVDLFWRFKEFFVFLGAALMALSFGIMIGLTGYFETMTKYTSAESWYIIMALIAPFAYMLQDVVADAMTTEAIPRFNSDGSRREEKEMRPEHITMQLLGRAAILFGGLVVAGASGWFAQMPAASTAMIMAKIGFGVIAAVIAIKTFKRVFKQKIEKWIIGIAVCLVLGLGIWMGISFFSRQFPVWFANVKSYEMIYYLAMLIPISSISGVALAFILRRKKKKNLLKQGFSDQAIKEMLRSKGEEKPKVNWWIMVGSAVFLAIVVPLGLLSLTFKMRAEIIPIVKMKIADLPFGFAGWLPAHADDFLFLGSLFVLCFLIVKIAKELTPEARQMLVGTAIIVFIFRMMPSVGAGLNFYYIERLKFDESFLGTLSQIGSFIALFGLFFLRPMMAKKSLAWTYGFLTILGAFFALPVIILVYGWHSWLAEIFGTDPYRMARTIALIDTVAVSPFGQLAMVPLLAWVAQDAPPKYKATYFALVASFTNLALSAAALGTKYLNEIFVIVKPIYDRTTGVLIKSGVYTELPNLVLTVGVVSLIFPMLAIILFTPYGGKEAIAFRIKKRLAFYWAPLASYMSNYSKKN